MVCQKANSHTAGEGRAAYSISTHALVLERTLLTFSPSILLDQKLIELVKMLGSQHALPNPSVTA